MPKTRERCVSTVFSLRKSCLAISRLVRPSVTRPRDLALARTQRRDAAVAFGARSAAPDAAAESAQPANGLIVHALRRGDIGLLPSRCELADGRLAVSRGERASEEQPAAGRIERGTDPLGIGHRAPRQLGGTGSITPCERDEGLGPRGCGAGSSELDLRGEG